MIKIGNKNDLTGMTFGRWTVLKENGKTKYGSIIWLCECSCNDKTQKNINNQSLLNGKSQSCGCISKEKKLNRYDLSGKYGVGWTNNTNEEFYFDLEDYDKIKDYTWNSGTKGYLISKFRVNGKRKNIKIHRIIMNVEDKNLHVDHINHNIKDNRKNNLRIVTPQQNQFNNKCIGVSYYKQRDKWISALTKDGVVHKKYFNNFEEALEYRKQLEEQYFGEYAYKETEDNEQSSTA